MISRLFFFLHSLLVLFFSSLTAFLLCHHLVVFFSSKYLSFLPYFSFSLRFMFLFLSLYPHFLKHRYIPSLSCLFSIILFHFFQSEVIKNSSFSPFSPFLPYFSSFTLAKLSVCRPLSSPSLSPSLSLFNLPPSRTCLPPSTSRQHPRPPRQVLFSRVEKGFGV